MNIDLNKFELEYILAAIEVKARQSVMAGGGRDYFEEDLYEQVKEKVLKVLELL